MQVSVVSNLLNTYSGLYCVRADFVAVCFPTALSTVVKGFVQMHVSEFHVYRHGFMAGYSFFNTQDFGTFFSMTDWRFSTFSGGFTSKAENCRNSLFFKKVFTLTSHQFSLNKIVCSFALYKYFVNYTPGSKSKLFSIIVNTKINASKTDFFCLKIVFIFLFELKRRELKFVKSRKKIRN